MNFPEDFNELLQSNHGLEEELIGKAVDITRLHSRLLELESLHSSGGDNQRLQCKSSSVTTKDLKNPRNQSTPSRIPVFNCPVYRKYILLRQYPMIRPMCENKDSVPNEQSPELLSQKPQKAPMKPQMKTATRDTVARPLQPVQTKKTCEEKDVFIPPVTPVVWKAGKASGSGTLMVQRTKPLPPIMRITVNHGAKCEKPSTVVQVPRRPGGNACPSQRVRRLVNKRPVRFFQEQSESQGQEQAYDYASLALEVFQLSAKVERVIRELEVLKREKGRQGGRGKEAM